jgi:hypothetical protein
MSDDGEGAGFCYLYFALLNLNLDNRLRPAYLDVLDHKFDRA